MARTSASPLRGAALLFILFLLSDVPDLFLPLNQSLHSWQSPVLASRAAENDAPRPVSFREVDGDQSSGVGAPGGANPAGSPHTESKQDGAGASGGYTPRETGYQNIVAKQVDEGAFGAPSAAGGPSFHTAHFDVGSDGGDLGSLRIHLHSQPGVSEATPNVGPSVISVYTANGPLPGASLGSQGQAPRIQTAGGAQMPFGWVPQVDMPSVAEKNLVELRKMLRDEGFVEALQVRAAEKGCPVYVLQNLKQIPVRFREVLNEEMEARSNPNRLFEVANSYVRTPEEARAWSGSESVSFEFSLAETRAAPAPADGGSSGFHIPPPPRPIPGQHDPSEEGRNPTAKRLVGTQLGLYLECKLQALLGHPAIFFNPFYSEQQLLETVAAAIGIAPPLREDEQDRTVRRDAVEYSGSVDQLLGAVELFRLASNPFTLGHAVLLMIAYLDYHAFFDPSPKKPFYSWATLAASAGNDTGFEMLDEMCDNHRGPKKPGRRAWYERGGSRKHKDASVTPLHRHLCDALEIILDGIQQTQIDVLEELSKYKVPVEPLVDPATNSARAQTRLCRGLSPFCDYEATILAPVRALDAHEQRESLKTKKAFNLLTGYGSGYVGQIAGDVAEPFLYAWRARWGKILSDPTAYSEVLERALWFEDREFLAKKNGYFFSQYDKMVKNKMSFGALDGVSEGLSERDIRSNLQSYIARRAEFVEKRKASSLAKLRKKIPERDPYAFNVAILLSLNARTYCTQSGSLLTKLRPFLASQFAKLSKSSNVPRTQRSMMAFFRTGQSKFFHEWCSFDPLAVNTLFLFRFALSGNDPAALNDKQHARVSKTKTTLRILQSKWTPNMLKKLLKGPNQKKMAGQAKALLLRSLDPNLLSGILTSFDFITHTQANLAVNQNSFMYHEAEQRGDFMKPSATQKAAHKLHQQGLVRHTDKIIKDWAEYGIPGDIKRRLAKGEQLPPGTTFGSIPIPDLTNWDAQLNQKWLDAYNSYLVHPYGRAALNAKDPVAMLIKDSRDRLQAEGEGTIFLGRIARRTHPSKNLLRRAGRALKKFFLSLLRENEQSDYAVWFGVKIDMRQVLQICRAINNVAEAVKNDRLYQYITDGWLELVKDVIAGYTKAHARVPGYDIISAANEQLRKQGRDAAIARNQGFLSIHYDYANLSEEERKKEFQLSMCMDHCEAVWKLIMAFVMPNLQNPQKLKSYEKDFSRAKEVEKLNDRHQVNAFRFSMSVQVDFFDNMLDKTSKKSLKAMKYGASTWFTYAMKLAGQVNTEMGNPHLGTTLYVQAPYYGDYIRKWMEERRQSRKQAIIGMLTLGMMGLYSLLSVTDIVQHMEDVGGAPPVSCVSNEVLGVACAPQAIAKATTSATRVATQDVLKVGLFAGIAPYLMLPMAVVSVWNILKSEIKILLQFEMAVKHMLSRLKRWLAAPFKNWWAKRGRLKDSLFKRASQTYKKNRTRNQEAARTQGPAQPQQLG
ncbi:rhoptry neck protein RON2 [Besnoitia besnoiti]|uniref:Rhoptry neck protein RON2 n=1 Tax=Besnoitia besnoiti TaxID=94643 RepID=A0A2A9MGI9_BESBE|nr:rhoptry neck protein RON2 [Besnoitia besnoiti]PFH37628.1 rhoptry neck protein RON2 [Besnoitia besnoiti]